MTLKDMDKSIAIHERQIKAIRELIHEGMRIVVTTRRDQRLSEARMKRIEAALELHITGKRSNGKGPANAR